MKINYFDPPKKSWEELMKFYTLDTCLVMDDVLSSKGAYRVVFQDLLDIMKYGFELEEVRKRGIRFKFHKEDKEIREIQMRHLLSNLILWQAFLDIDKVELLNEDYIFDFTQFSTNTLITYIDEKLLPIHDGDFASKNSMVDEICHSIISISHAFCMLMGMSISIYDIIQVEKRNPKLTELISGPLDVSMQPNEIENELDRRTKEVIDIFVKDSCDNDIKPLFIVGKNIKPAQFKEFIVKIGMKSDINGNTIPIVIDTNFLLNGLPKPSLIYINTIGGRKSLIMTKTKMGIPGAFSKKLSQATTSASMLRRDDESCDTMHCVTYFIRDDLFLKMLDGRNYYDARGTLQMLNYRKDKHLIGKMVPFRSPVTCCSTEGICKTCYGHLYDINSDMVSVGTLASLKISEPTGQIVLSSKHTQTTHSEELKFTEGFSEIFEATSNEVTFKENSNLDADLYIRFGEVSIEELDDAEYYFCEAFDIVDGGNKTIYHIAEDNGAKLYLNDQIAAQYKKLRDKATPISLENFDDDESLFTIEVKNRELTEPIKVFTKLLNTNDHMGATTISELCQKFAEALIEMGTTYDLVHAECIIRALVRKKSNIMEFPDFSRAGDPNDWQIVKLNDSLMYNPSALVSMPYGYLRKQLLSTELYEKHAPSHLDTLYVRDLANWIEQ